MPVHDLLFDGNSKSLRISHHFKDIHCGNVRGHDLDFWNGLSSNVTMPIESQYMTFHLTVIVICTPSVTISKIFIFEIYMTLTLTWAKVKCNYAS